MEKQFLRELRQEGLHLTYKQIYEISVLKALNEYSSLIEFIEVQIKNSQTKTQARLSFPMFVRVNNQSKVQKFNEFQINEEKEIKQSETMLIKTVTASN